MKPNPNAILIYTLAIVVILSVAGVIGLSAAKLPIPDILTGSITLIIGLMIKSPLSGGDGNGEAK